MRSFPFNKREFENARFEGVTQDNVEVGLVNAKMITTHSYHLKPQHLTALPPEQEPQMQELSDRISKLRSCDLDPFEREILSMLERPIGNCTQISQGNQARQSFIMATRCSKLTPLDRPPCYIIFNERSHLVQ